MYRSTILPCIFVGLYLQIGCNNDGQPTIAVNQENKELMSASLPYIIIVDVDTARTIYSFDCYPTITYQGTSSSQASILNQADSNQIALKNFKIALPGQEPINAVLKPEDAARLIKAVPSTRKK